MNRQPRSLLRRTISSYRFNEIVLAGGFAIPWGLILVLTPDDLFARVSRLTSLVIIIPDIAVGICLIACGLALLFVPSLRVKQFVHGFLFGVWNFIVYLGFSNGVTPVSCLVCLPYFAIALIHAGSWWRLSQERQVKL